MNFGRHVISQWWQDHHKEGIALAVVAWVVFITLAYHRINARPPDDATSLRGTVTKILPVGGLPVT